MPSTYAFSLTQNSYMHLRLPIIMGVIMPLTISCFIVPIVEEHHNNLIIMQRLAGVSVFIVWVVSVFWDMLTFLAFSIVYAIIIYIAIIKDYHYSEKASNIYEFILIIIVFFSNIIYCCSVIRTTQCSCNGNACFPIFVLILFS